MFALQTNEFEVINLAVDQMQTYDFLRRTKANSWSGYEHSRREETEGHADVNPMDTTYDYCVAKDGNIYSIENVKRLQNVKYDGSVPLSLLVFVLHAHAHAHAHTSSSSPPPTHSLV